MKCSNYKEYLDAVKRFGDYMEMVEQGQMPYVSRFKSDSDDGVSKETEEKCLNYLYEYDMTTKEQLQEMLDDLEGKYLPNLQDILKTVITNLGNEYSDGILIGLNVTEEDYYYIFQKKGSSERCYSSCVGKLMEK